MRRTRLTADRGAILIQVAVASLALTAFTMFVVDYGILWVGRHQAQNAADAGALAGAIALALDDFEDRGATGPARVTARAFALANDIWGEDPEVSVETDVVFVPCPDDPTPPPLDDTPCIRVDVYRGAGDRADAGVPRGTPLPTWFGTLVGVTEQGVRATATAEVATGNASSCLKPWGVADRWEENNPDPDGTWSGDATFDPTAEPPAMPDVYVAPDPGLDDPGTGFRSVAGPSDLGAQLTLTVGSATSDVTPGWFQALDLCTGLPGQGFGAQCYEESIRGCVGSTWGIGDEIPVQAGDMVGPTGVGASDLIDLDPGAYWDSLHQRVDGSCVGPPYSCPEPGYAHSPRIVALPVFDLVHFVDTGGPGSGTVRIVNIVGFFVESVDVALGRVTGRLLMKVDLLAADKGSGTPSASFLRVPLLVR